MDECHLRVERSADKARWKPKREAGVEAQIGLR